MSSTLTTRSTRETIARHFEEAILPTLATYTEIPCLSPAFSPSWESDGHLAKAAQLLATWTKAQGVSGLNAEILAPSGRTPLLFIEVPGTPGVDGTVLIYGHMDKQPPMGVWRDGLDPFKGVRDGERFYGRGTGDDGYSVFAGISALVALETAKVSRPRTVLLIEASEESGSPDLRAHLDDVMDRIGEPTLVICLDSGALTYDRLWRTSSLRGNIVATVTVSVLREGVHSGNAGGILPTSFRILRRLLSRIEDEETGEILLSGLHATIPEWAKTDHRAVAEEMPGVVEESFVALEGVSLLGTTATDRLLRRAWAPALAVTGMEGLPRPTTAGNVLRPSTTAKISLRLPPTVDAEEATALIRSALTKDVPEGAHVAVEFETPAPGWVGQPLRSPLATAFAQASKVALGNEPGAFGEGGTIPFLSLLGERFPDAQILATGVLGPNSNAHGPNEFLHIPMAQAVTLAVAELISAVGS
jgi:acetylornithine deacetylase/succinyl-diaminopimelate desuccinylase-like protein